MSTTSSPGLRVEPGARSSSCAGIAAGVDADVAADVVGAVGGGAGLKVLFPLPDFYLVCNLAP